jgi:hypothetical protein
MITRLLRTIRLHRPFKDGGAAMDWARAWRVAKDQDRTDRILTLGY